MKNISSELQDSLRLPTRLQRKRLNQVITKELTPLQRETLIAYYFENMTLEAIARRRGVFRSTVCRTLHRAENRLIRYLRY